MVFLFMVESPSISSCTWIITIRCLCCTRLVAAIIHTDAQDMSHAYHVTSQHHTMAVVGGECDGGGSGGDGDDGGGGDGSDSGSGSDGGSGGGGGGSDDDGSDDDDGSGG